MRIDWDEVVPGRRQSPSTVHGWLAKMRGTLLGDERLRSRGMREMREAQYIRANKQKKKAQREASIVPGTNMFSFLATNKRSPLSSQRRNKPSSSSRSSQQHRPRDVPNMYQVPARVSPTGRPEYKRRGTSSRQHSYNSHHSGARPRTRRR